MDPVVIKIPATRENFDEAGYLAANPDVAQAVAAGRFKSTKQHFEEFGIHEGRMQWSIHSMPPEGRRIHPLSAYSREGIRDQIQHFFANAPELPNPLLEPNASGDGDVEICARLIDAFSRAVAYEQDNIPPEKRPNDGVWETLKTTAHAEAYRLLVSKDAARLADSLRNGLRTTLCNDLRAGAVNFQIMSGTDWRDSILRLVDGLAALAEAIGALPYEHPAMQYGQNIHLAVGQLTNVIERKLRFAINRPKVMGIYGIGTNGGIIDISVPEDAYCAHRIRLICGDISNTRFIEIGGGFGGMALFALRAGAKRWPIVDLPIINVVQGFFLIKCLGENAVRLFGENNPAAAAEALPYWEFFDRARDYSVVFNRASLPEIPRERVDEYLAEIETREAVLLSSNYEAAPPPKLNLHQVIAERGKLECRSRHPIGSEGDTLTSCSYRPVRAW
jgi:hypothetical protein